MKLLPLAASFELPSASLPPLFLSSFFLPLLSLFGVAPLLLSGFASIQPLSLLLLQPQASFCALIDVFPLILRPRGVSQLFQLLLAPFAYAFALVHLFDAIE